MKTVISHQLSFKFFLNNKKKVMLNKIKGSNELSTKLTVTNNKSVHFID